MSEVALLQQSHFWWMWIFQKGSLPWTIFSKPQASQGKQRLSEGGQEV
jgi:hypothetical protein